MQTLKSGTKVSLVPALRHEEPHVPREEEAPEKIKNHAEVHVHTGERPDRARDGAPPPPAGESGRDQDQVREPPDSRFPRHEVADAAAVETVRRIEAGRPYVQGFAGAISPGVDVRVIRREVGANSAYQEIQVSATVRRVAASNVSSVTRRAPVR